MNTRNWDFTLWDGESKALLSKIVSEPCSKQSGQAGKLSSVSDHQFPSLEKRGKGRFSQLVDVFEARKIPFMPE